MTPALPRQPARSGHRRGRRAATWPAHKGRIRACASFAVVEDTPPPLWLDTMERRDAQFAGSYLAMRQSILKDGAIPAKYKLLMGMITDAIAAHPDVWPHSPTTPALPVRRKTKSPRRSRSHTCTAAPQGLSWALTRSGTDDRRRRPRSPGLPAIRRILLDRQQARPNAERDMRNGMTRIRIAYERMNS